MNPLKETLDTLIWIAYSYQTYQLIIIYDMNYIEIHNFPMSIFSVFWSYLFIEKFIPIYDRKQPLKNNVYDSFLFTRDNVIVHLNELFDN
jgi:hypothetical protein